ncbi:hypothetical protein RCL_jg13958.t1 [Rhizophagus clarus]|uniref:Uncharacterized protein n=1 Tax=Rhizophagus clarus TaxID=94130 RepID=A0A8H3LRF0_9GLOM|nr:hypothetical protein RCL_jg13958.t1 [Rhizophagus clarus]
MFQIRSCDLQQIAAHPRFISNQKLRPIENDSGKWRESSTLQLCTSYITMAALNLEDNSVTEELLICQQLVAVTYRGK